MLWPTSSKPDTPLLRGQDTGRLDMTNARSTAADNNSVARNLAALTERLANHMDNCERIETENKREREMAAAERREILQRMQIIDHDMKEVKPMSDFLRTARASAVGGIFVLSVLWALALSGVLFWKTQLVAAFSKIFGG